MCGELKPAILDHHSRKVGEKATYMGIPIEQIVIMYDYLKNHDGAIDGGFSEGFLAGARYASEAMQASMRDATIGIFERTYLGMYEGGNNGKE